MSRRCPRRSELWSPSQATNPRPRWNFPRRRPTYSIRSIPRSIPQSIPIMATKAPSRPWPPRPRRLWRSANRCPLRRPLLPLPLPRQEICLRQPRSLVHRQRRRPCLQRRRSLEYPWCPLCRRQRLLRLHRMYCLPPSRLGKPRPRRRLVRPSQAPSCPHTRRQGRSSDPRSPPSLRCPLLYSAQG